MSNYTPDKLTITKDGNTYVLDLATRVAVNQGSVNEGKVLGIGSNGTVVPVDLSDSSFISIFTNMVYPVGSIYITTLTNIPVSFSGTWIEIVMPITWNELKRGTRTYTELPEDPPNRTVHFFLRIR